MLAAQVFGPDPDLLTRKVQGPGLQEEFSEGLTGEFGNLQFTGLAVKIFKPECLRTEALSFYLESSRHPASACACGHRSLGSLTPPRSLNTKHSISYFPMTVMKYCDQKEHIKGSLFGSQIQRRGP